MSNLCESCDHLSSEHANGGRCTGECFDPDYDTRYLCVCPVFVRDPDGDR